MTGLKRPASHAENRVEGISGRCDREEQVPGSSRISVLVVEDSPTQAKYLQRLLIKHDFDVRIASNGREAAGSLAVDVPDIIVSDVIMPEMDGYDLCRHLRADARLRDLPVILVTSLSEPSEVISALEAGASNFLAKPYDEETLIERVWQTLKTSESDASDESTLAFEYNGRSYSLRSDRRQMVGFLLSTLGDTITKNVQLGESNQRLTDAVRTISRLESRYRQLMETSVEAMLVVDGDRFVVYANHAAESLFACARDDLVGTPFPFEIKLDQPTEIDFQLSESTTVFAELKMVETQWGGKPAFLASLWDVTENVLLRQTLSELSLTDELTGLHNRRGFMTLADQQLKVARRGDQSLMLLYADMDGLKTTNDTFGHAAGDAAIRETADVLRQTLRDSDILARIGGDEFAALLVDVDPPESISRVCDRINAAFEARNAAGRTAWTLGVSTGVIAHDPDDPRDLDALIQAADALMYQQKVSRRVGRA